MTDRNEVPLETEEGWRPRTSGGERILVALAAIALLSGVLIVAGNLLTTEDPVSVASASPRPTSSPLPTATPIPTPQVLVLVPQSPASGEPAPLLFNGWIRPKVDLPIMAAASDGGIAVGTLPAGTTVYADEQQDSASSQRGWLYVEGPGQAGYVATLDAGGDLVRRYQVRPGQWPGGIGYLAAGPHGLVAIGSQSGGSDRSYPESSVFASADGVSWHRSGIDSELSCCLTSVAWGSAGWLLVGGSNNSDGVWVWSSADGEDWRALGFLAAGYAQSLSASERGYLLVTSGSGRGEEQTWFSTDGLHWTTVDTGLTSSAGFGGSRHLFAATDAGFYAWADACCIANPQAAFSLDGRRWSLVANPPGGVNLRVVALNGSLIGIDTDAATATSHAWLGSIDAGRLSWRPMPRAAEPFGNGVVTAVVSDGRYVIALGWDKTSEVAMAWASDDGSWSRSLLPGDFGGIPAVAAGGAAGVAVVGHQWNLRGDNPVLWHWNGAASWAPEDVPVVAAAPNPSVDECPRLPVDAISFVNLDRPEAVACFGDAPIKVRVWSNPCDGCLGAPGGTYEQGWLAAPEHNVLAVGPVQWPDMSWAYLIVDPSLGNQIDPSWSGTWLEVTGHFDDPRATACRWIPDADTFAYYSGARQTIESCRQQFVVTRVRVVSGP